MGRWHPSVGPFDASMFDPNVFDINEARVGSWSGGKVGSWGERKSGQWAGANASGSWGDRKRGSWE